MVKERRCGELFISVKKSMKIDKAQGNVIMSMLECLISYKGYDCL